MFEAVLTVATGLEGVLNDDGGADVFAGVVGDKGIDVSE